MIKILKKHRSKIENSLIVKFDQNLRSSIRKRNRYYNDDTNENYNDTSQIVSKNLRSSKSKSNRCCIIINDDNDDDSTQIISIVVFQNKNNDTFDFKLFQHVD